MSRRRLDIRGILADPNLRRELMVPTIQSTQAREGIETTHEQAERAYYVVTEGERATFFDLEPFRAIKRQPERRHEMFVRSLQNDEGAPRIDVVRRDFGFIEGSLLAYRNIVWLAPLFKDHPSLDPAYGATRSGLNTTEIERFTRQRWEVATDPDERTWVLFAKGGDFSRFYSDWDLVIDWKADGKVYKGVVAEKYGSASRFVKSESDYFRPGVTWMQTTNLGINARLLPGLGIFGVASPTFFPNDAAQMMVFLAVMNSALFDALAHCVATRNWGATAIGSIPIPRMSATLQTTLGEMARSIHDCKANWDDGNETSTRFSVPWILRKDLVGGDSLGARLEALSRREQADENDIREAYARLNDAVFSLYGIPDQTRARIEEGLGERPPELLWPQQAGKSPDQKRMEHVWRLLSYAVKRVLEADDDGIVGFNAVNGEPRLVERVRQELATLFPGRDANQVEVEIVNELKRTVKGYRKCASLDEWLDNAFFEYHAGLYKNRPIFWHIASAQGTSRFAFGALVHYHRFDKNRMAKLRASYLRDAIEEFRREAGLADKAGRTDDRIEWQSKVEEAQALDKKLQLIQEGHHDGAEGGERDYRILTPWKEPHQRPKGWDPDLDDGVKVNIEPFEKAGVLRLGKVT
ncbi:MAG: hypothetical protein JNL68_18980 [Burkholderiales bacterium]|nr:hypothetical protein [Burkholderiales bacterium]